MNVDERDRPARRPVMLKVVRAIAENPEVKTLVFHDEAIAAAARPGNFVMLWLPGGMIPPETQGETVEGAIAKEAKGEVVVVEDLMEKERVADNIPMGISSVDVEKGEFSVTVRAVGATTKALQRCEQGTVLGITGPLGNCFTVDEKNETIIVAGGGFGSAPLRFLCERLRTTRPDMNIFGIFGARTQWEHIFIEDFQRLCDFVLFTTDDGSFGCEGIVCDSVDGLMDITGTPDALYACGPEAMMFSLRDHPALADVKEQQYSMERLMRCGIGLCGSCSLENGLWVCRDGPVFDGKVLDEIRGK